MHRILYLSLFLAFIANAQTIYKYVDEQGNVIYSEDPPTGQQVEIIQTPPEPSKEEVEAAREREQKLQKQPDALDQDEQEPVQDQEPTTGENAEISRIESGYAIPSVSLFASNVLTSSRDHSNE